MAIRITSRKGGFRRCKIEHPATPTVYSNDRFTQEELARLKAEPMLIVEEIADAPIGVGADTPPVGDPLDKMTVPQLQEYAAAPERNIDLGGATRKSDILAAIKAAEAAKVAGVGPEGA